MKIMQIIGGYEAGGSRGHLITLSKELINKGIKVEIICFTDDIVAKTAREQDIPVKIFPMKNIFDFRVITKLNKYIKESNPEIIHTHGFRANFIGRLANVGDDTPIITTVHSSMYYDYSNQAKKVLYHRIDKLTRSLTNKFIAVSESLKKELEQDGIPSERIAMVYNGLPMNFPLNVDVKPYIREELGIAADTPLLISVGRLESVKNHKMLFDVFATLKQNNIKYHGLIVGGGSLQKELKELSETLAIDDRIHILGFREDVYQLLSEADLFLLTSTMEGFGVTLLEAMAAHTPVVVTEVGGMQEVVKLANNGYVIPVGDIVQFVARIEAILAQPELKKKFAENGYNALLKYFSTAKFVENTIDVYKQVLDENKKEDKKVSL